MNLSLDNSQYLKQLQITTKIHKVKNIFLNIILPNTIEYIKS